MRGDSRTDVKRHRTKVDHRDSGLHLLMVVIRFTVFVPLHVKLDKAKSMELIDKLLKYDIYPGSGIPTSIKMIATIVMLYQVVSAP